MTARLRLFLFLPVLSILHPASVAAATAPDAAGLLHGAIDLHCHSAPDTMPRSVDDPGLARLARAAGLRAIVLKNHYTGTADRAQLASHAIGGGIEIFGGIVLNRAVGGLNPEAVRRMAEMTGGRGRLVWLPTFDAEHAVRSAGERRPFVAIVSDGKPAPELAEIFRLAVDHRLVLATGHASAAESLIVVAAARAAGVQQVLVTHALLPALRATDEQLSALARLGAWIEFSWLMHHVPAPEPGLPAALARPMVPLDRCIAALRAVGPAHAVLSSDFGQAINPPPPEGLRAFLNALLAAGVPANDLDLMVRRNPARVLGLDP